jgi:hypothetical protein
MAQRPIYDYTGKTNEDLLLEARGTIEGMTDNTYFPTPNPTVEALTTSADKYDEKLTASIKGSALQHSEFKDARIELEGIMHEMALYIFKTVGYNKTKLDSSKIPLTKEPSAPTRESFKLKKGKDINSVEVSIKAVEHAHAYIYMIFYGDENMPENPKDWKLGDGNSRCKTILKNLTNREKLWIAVAAITKDGLQPFNQPKWIIVT